MPNLTLRYIISLLLIGTLLVLGNILVQNMINTQLNDARVINIAGRQRMLSQKISKTVLEIEFSQNEQQKQTLLNELENDVHVWKESHEGLQSGNISLELPGDNSDAVDALFASINIYHQTILQHVQTILEHSDEPYVITTARTTILEHESPFLEGMNSIVFQYDREAQARVIQLASIQHLILVSILVLLVIEGFFIFRPAIKKAQQIDQAKTEFVSIASHQLNTPLTAINWATEMLLEEDIGRLNKKQKMYIQNIRDTQNQMKGLVDALLNVSRIDIGAFSLETKPTDVHQLTKIALKDFQPLLESKQLLVDLQSDTSIPKISIDPKLLLIVMQNLISNAIKYTPDNGTITIQLSKKKKMFQFSIQDTGFGIPKTQQHLVFKKLFRADNVQEKNIDGTGLGLYVTKSIVEKFNGKITFSSIENRGTTFLVTIPLKGIKSSISAQGKGLKFVG